MNPPNIFLAGIVVLAVGIIDSQNSGASGQPNNKSLIGQDV